MTEDPLARNRLGDAASPYLRQHADNPVNWQPWDDAALDAAAERDRPIFLSVGYAACHWCHVMAEESFQDEDVAELLNDHFVPIKVDREERPDIDSIYMSICQQVTGRGGWPLSVWLTPDLEPFYVGTYFPREQKRGMPGFASLLEDVAASWEDPDQREDVRQRAGQWTDAIESDLGDVPEGGDGVPDAEAVRSGADTAVRAADREHGGWGGRDGPKFPQPARLQLLLRAHYRAADASKTGIDERGGAGTDAEYLAVARETLDAMGDGGLFDQLGGGFHRYCTDREWIVPHFEKMLYDNAELPVAFLAGLQRTGRDRYRTVVERTLAFLDRELGHPEGAFYSTLDARSQVPGGEEREEGRFYTWTPDEVAAALDDAAIASELDGTAADVVDEFDADDDLDLADLACEHFGVDTVGDHEGRSVLTVADPADALAERHDVAVEPLATVLERIREALFAARAERPRPPRDEKVLAGWNGLTVSALARASIALDDVAHAERAVEALEFVRGHCWTAPADRAASSIDDSEEATAGDETTAVGHLHRRVRDGEVGVDGYLADYAFLGRGALDCFQATGEVAHLAFALDVARALEHEFWDAEAGTLYFTPTSGEDLVARPQELGDQSTPSSTGVAVELLQSLDHFVPHDRFREVATTVLETHADEIEASPMEHASLLLAVDEHHHGRLEFTLATDDPPAAWRRTLADAFAPDRLLAWRPPTAEGLDDWLDELGLSAAPPIWADREARDGATVYACRDFSCSPPMDDVASALEWARE